MSFETLIYDYPQVIIGGIVFCLFFLIAIIGGLDTALMMTLIIAVLSGMVGVSTIVSLLVPDNLSTVTNIIIWLIMVSSLFFILYNNRETYYRTAEVDQWLLVIENGNMLKAGIGLRSWLNPLRQSAVTFPSSVTKTEFSALQVTKEMQGVEISGFAMFGVNRTDEGPFKYYKYAGNDIEKACDNIRLVVESIVRHQIANHTIQQVMQKRELMRNQIKADVMSAVGGWGVWIETIEISDVRISSRSLFEDLQAEFRQESRLAAENLKLSTKQKVNEQRLQTELIVSKKTADTAAQRKLYEAQQNLRREEEESKLLSKQMETARARMEQEKKLDVQKIINAHEIQQMKLDKKLAIANQEKEEQVRLQIMELEAESTMSQINLQKYQIDSTERIYQNLPLKDMKVHNYMGSGGGAASLLPAIQQLQKSWQTAQDTNDEDY